MKKLQFLLFFFSSFILAQETQRFIDVNGTAEILVQSDYIDFNINIRTIAETLEESRQQNINASDELIKIISEFSINKDDWELSPIKLGKEYSYNHNERELIGYYSQTSVVVKLRQLTEYYNFINRLSKNSMYEITSSNYGISDLLKYHKQATINAVKAAREKAEYIAENMGIKVGKILQITEQSSFQDFPPLLNATTMTGSGGSEISGKVSISRSVNMRVEIVD